MNCCKIANPSLLFLLMLPAGACSGGDDMIAEPAPVPVSFSARVEEATGASARAATPMGGDITTANIPSMGVYAYYTGQQTCYQAVSDMDANFMDNQKVEKQGDVWTYEPVKYWPGTAGDKISFFAYAPHATPTGTSVNSPGLGVYFIRPAGYTTKKGTPLIYFRTPPKEKEQIDLLGGRLLDCTRSGNSLSFEMKHVLVKVEFRVKSSDAIQLNMLKLVDVWDIADIGFASNGIMSVSAGRASGADPVDVQAYLNNGAMDIEADKETTAATFYLPAGKPETAVLAYTSGGTAQEKTMELPGAELWKAGQHVIYTIVIEKTNLKISIAADGLTWKSGGAEENINDNTPIATN